MRHTITTSIQSPAGTIANVENIDADAELSRLDETIPENATTEVGFPVLLAGLALLWILSDKDLTLKTNDAGAPDDTIELTAGIPYIWREGDAALSADILSLHVVSGADNGDARLQAGGLYDPTPA